ncbi:MAG: hypothetical protein ACPLRJ_07115, partial [Infirmifilum uzonense]|uniref:hypothetical protein n=1 Tax=Infirmifilum uzonense TaxID=1550241 RepID=UPI003C788C71
PNATNSYVYKHTYTLISLAMTPSQRPEVPQKTTSRDLQGKAPLREFLLDVLRYIFVDPQRIINTSR